MKRTMIMMAAAALTLGGCTKVTVKADGDAAESKVAEAEAAAAADAAQAAWISQDVARIEAVYAKDVVAFDPVDAPLSTTWENWHRLQTGFAAMKFDGIEVKDRKIQILDGEDFIASGTAIMTSKDGPEKSAPMRFTDVYRRQADGKFLIVNEHVSMVPEPPKT